MAYHQAQKVFTTHGDLRTRPAVDSSINHVSSGALGPPWETPTLDRDGNTAGRVTAMTMLTRLQGWGAPYLRLVLWALRHFHPLVQQRALSFIHFAHFSVLDGLAVNAATGAGARKDTYLLFESNFNGLWQEYIEAFCHVIGLDINVLLAGCEGFPGLVPARGFKTFMEHHEFLTEHYYAAYPQASTTLIRAAAELDGDLARMRKLAAGLDDDAFARAWYDLLALSRVQANLAGQACTQPGLAAYLRQLVFGRKNVAGKAYAFVALTPLQPGRVEELRAYLRRLPRDAQSPLANVAGTHVGRWVVLDRVFHDSWPEQFEVLDPAYLLFTAVFDMTSRDALASYLDRLLSGLGTEADAIWGFCQGWPSDGGQRERNAYLRHHQRDAQFLFAGYPSSVAEIRRALTNRELLVGFAKQAQTLAPHQLRAAFLAAIATGADRSAHRGDKR